MRRVKVARVPDFPEGELRQVRIPPTSDGAGEGAILLTRVDGQFYATGASCSHYSAPLAEGVAARDRMHVVCPWHNAAFDIRTGQPVRGAGLQAIPTYKVTVESEDVIVDLPRDMEDFVAPNMVQRDSQDSRVFVVLGGGAAGVAAADALRQEGYTGRIVLISEEKHLPYDRPVLSKNLGKASDPGSLSLRDQEYFDKHEIEIRRSAKVEKLDAASKTVHLTSKQTIRYDAAVVATGARPRELPIKGAELPEVLALRTPEDAQRIAAACSSGRKVVSWMCEADILHLLGSFSSALLNAHCLLRLSSGHPSSDSWLDRAGCNLRCRFGRFESSNLEQKVCTAAKAKREHRCRHGTGRDSAASWLRSHRAWDGAGASLRNPSAIVRCCSGPKNA